MHRDEIIVKDLIKSSPKLNNIYQQCLFHEGNHREIRFYTSTKIKGRIEYFTKYVEINFDLRNEFSELILAHELMHYLLVLDGALLPVPTRDELPYEVEFIRSIIMRGLTHHPLLKVRLDQVGYMKEQEDDFISLANFTADIPLNYPVDNKIYWLLDNLDRSTFSKGIDLNKLLLPEFEREGCSDLYNLFQQSFQTIGDINNLSIELIKKLNLSEYIVMGNLELYLEAMKGRYPSSK
nr:hypothetical protein [Heyndrickxia oleronia]